jgi:hypothetical protein
VCAIKLTEEKEKQIFKNLFLEKNVEERGNEKKIKLTK